MNHYTVVLMYPDYLTDNFGQETYSTSVRAWDVAGAITEAQLEAASANNMEPDDEGYEDFHPVAVFEGEISNLAP
jgi:hypothetical protein